MDFEFTDEIGERAVQISQSLCLVYHDVPTADLVKSIVMVLIPAYRSMGLDPAEIGRHVGQCLQAEANERREVNQ